jgi:hypothetical protein
MKVLKVTNIVIVTGGLAKGQSLGYNLDTLGA